MRRCAEPLRAPDPVFAARHVLHAGHHGMVTHDYAAVSFYIAGAARIDLGGHLSLSAGDVLLIPPGAPHALLAAEGAEIWGLGLCVACYVAGGAEDLVAPFDRVRSGASPVVTIPEARRPFMEHLFRELARETETPGDATLAVQKSFVTLIMSEISRAAAIHPSSAQDDGPVAAALRFIERRCLGPLSLRDVAEAVRRSPAHLTTLVRRSTGRSVQAWIIAGRLAEARRRLLHTDEMIDVIAERIGYADATHFIRVFRRAHGMTPAAWRAKNREATARPPRPAPP